MSRRIRLIAGVVGLVVVVVVVLPFLISVDQFRPTLEEKASAALGRKVTLGKISFSLLSGSLSAEDLTIAEDSKYGQSPFLTAKALNVGVELVPLIFSKKLNVTGVIIDNPKVTLLRNPGGEWNVSSLGGTSAKPSTSTSGTPGDLSIKKVALKNGQIIVGSTHSQQRSTYDHVDITVSDFSMMSAFPVVVTAELPGGGKFKLEGKAGPVDQANAALTPLDAKLNISALKLASTGFLDSSAGLDGLLDLDATLRSQNGNAETKGKAKLSKALLVAGGSPASEPVTVDFSTKYDLHKNVGVLSPSTLKIGGAAAQLNGTYQTAGENTVVNIKLDGQNMPAKDLASFLPALGINLPKGATLPAGTLNASLGLSGPTNRLVTSGNVGLFGARLAGFDLGSKMSAISALAGIQTGKDLQIEKLTTNLRIAPDGLQAENFLAVVPTLGNLTGGGAIDSRNNLDFKMAAVLANASGTAGTPAYQAVGMLNKLMGGGSGCKGETAVPFMIQGTTSEPKFVPDVEGLAAGMLKSRLGCADSASATEAGQKQQSSNPLSGLTGLFGKRNKQ